MKKLLIATAALAMVAGTAQAQSSVTVYGVLSSGYASTTDKFQGTENDDDVISSESYSRKTTSTGVQGLQAGSRLGFRGTEDLGGGLKAGFVYERGISMVTATDSIRQGFISLAGNFGEVRLGRMNSLSKDMYDTYNAHAGSGFAPGNQSAAIGALVDWAEDADGFSADVDSTNPGAYGNVRHSNIVTFITPTFNGITLRAQYGQDKQTGDEASDINDRILNFGATYTSGPLNLAIANDTQKNIDNEKLTRRIIGGTYNFGTAILFVANTSVKNTANDLNLKDNTIGVHVPLGKTTLIGSYSNGDITVGGGDAADTKGYQIGANYALSKRTFALVRYGKSEANASGSEAEYSYRAKASVDGFGVGLQHSF
jgi:predicted porin